MKGVSRFDFYIDRWFGGTRGVLSPQAKGVYIDLLCLIYSKGGSIPYAEDEPSEGELVGKCGLKRRDTLRRILDELIAKEKIVRRDGMLFNGRATEELTKVACRRGDEPGNGVPPKKPERANKDATKLPLRAHLDATKLSLQAPGIVVHQQDSSNGLRRSVYRESESSNPSTESRPSAREVEPAKIKNSKKSFGSRRRAARVGAENIWDDPNQRQAYAEQKIAQQLGRDGRFIIDRAWRGDQRAFAVCRTAAAAAAVLWPVPKARPPDVTKPALDEQPDYVPKMPERVPAVSNVRTS